jgi:sulfur-carrier protein
MFRDVMPPDRDEEEGSAVADLLELLRTGYPGLWEALFTAEEQIRDFVNMLKNGRNIHFCGELQTTLC